MQKNIVATFLLTLCVGAVLPAKQAYADMGPKPSSIIHVKLDGKPIEKPFQARMLVCAKYASGRVSGTEGTDYWQEKEDLYTGDRTTNIDYIVVKDAQNNCYWRNHELVQGGDCSKSKCYFTYYVPNRFRMAIQLSQTNNTSLTAPIDRTGFISTYNVDLTKDGEAHIVSTTDSTSGDVLVRIINFIFYLVATIFVEIVVALILFESTKEKKRLLKTLIICNLLSLPIVWTMVSKEAAYGLRDAEILALIIEAVIYLLVLGKQYNKIKLIFLALAANIASFTAGVIIYGTGLGELVVELLFRFLPA